MIRRILLPAVLIACTAAVVLGAQNATFVLKSGERVSGTYGSSTLWDKIGSGYIADAYVSTGSDGQVAPDCP